MKNAIKPLPQTGPAMRAYKSCKLAFVLSVAVASAPQAIYAESKAVSGAKEARHIHSPLMLFDQLKHIREKIDKESRPISLHAAIEAGIKSNPSLRSAFMQVQQYKWAEIAEERAWLPTLNLANGSPFLGGSYTSEFNQSYESYDSELSQNNDSTYTNLGTFQPGINMTWNFFDPSRIPKINASSDTARQYELLFDVAARSLILEIQKSYYALQSTNQLIKNYERIYKINLNQYRIAEAQYNAGMATILDREQTKSQLMQQLNQLINYSHQYINQASALSMHIGEETGALSIPNQPASLYGEWNINLDDSISKAINLREEVLSSLAAAESANWAGIAQVRSYLPVLQLFGTGSLDISQGINDAPIGGNSSAYRSSSRAWDAYIGLGMTWSIFDGGVQAANAMSSYALAKKEQAQAETNKLKAIQQVRSSYGKYRTAQVGFNVAKQNLNSANISQLAARERFNVGVGDMTTFVQSMNQLGEATQQMSKATLAYNTAVAELYRYTSTWPLHTQPLVEARVERMR